MRRSRKPIERGWVTFAGSTPATELVNTAVDNIRTVVSDRLLDFDDFQPVEDENLLGGQDDVADFYIEAVRGVTAHSAGFGLGNETGVLQLAWGLVIGDQLVLDDIGSSGIPGLANTAFWDADFRASPAIRQVMMVHFDLAFETFAQAAAANYDTTKYFKEWSLGQIHLRRGEGIYMVATQTGLSDDFFPWTDGDTVITNHVINFLVRQKRGRG